MEKNLILGIGEALWDCLPEGRKIGGAPANFAYHAGQFGWRNIVVSAVGNDALGDEYLEQLADVKLEPMIARVPFPARAFLRMKSARMWRGTISLGLMPWRHWRKKRGPCASVHWPSAVLSRALRSIGFWSQCLLIPNESLILICANHIITGRLSGRISNVQPSSSSMMRKSRWSRTYSIWTAHRNLSAGN